MSLMDKRTILVGFDRPDNLTIVSLNKQKWTNDPKTAEFVCLHSLSSRRARTRSKKVVRNVYYTTFQDAKKLLADGQASVDDCLV